MVILRISKSLDAIRRRAISFKCELKKRFPSGLPSEPLFPARNWGFFMKKFYTISNHLFVLKITKKC
ncbi:MAG: hypothetical protein A2176_09895 [Spirochaetes bacterium RBG_13_51_14]|nr:MAG: hypothetical protein A2176_09895 [Spirochaetes bacterium RBG_13_51_14]